MGLEPNELRRRLWHFLPGMLALGSPILPHAFFLSPLWPVLVIGVTLTLFAIAVCCQKSFQRDHESNCLSSIFSFGVCALPLLFFFRSRPELGMTALGIMAFGDGSATLVGLLMGGRKLPWNAKKSWIGSMTFILVAVPIAAFIYCGNVVPNVSIEMSVARTAPVVLVAALVESLPGKFNDNFLVGGTAAVAMVCVQLCTVGAWQ